MSNRTNDQVSRNLPLVCAIVAVTTLGIGQLGAQPMPEGNQTPLFLTATNGDSNYLAVINSRTKQVSYVATGGKGGASGNAGASRLMGISPQW